MDQIKEEKFKEFYTTKETDEIKNKSEEANEETTKDGSKGDDNERVPSTNISIKPFVHKHNFNLLSVLVCAVKNKYPA